MEFVYREGYVMSQAASYAAIDESATSSGTQQQASIHNLVAFSNPNGCFTILFLFVFDTIMTDM